MKNVLSFRSQSPSSFILSIFFNFDILLIILQINHAYVDVPKIIYEGIYKTNETLIFTWFLMLNIIVDCTI